MTDEEVNLLPAEEQRMLCSIELRKANDEMREANARGEDVLAHMMKCARFRRRLSLAIDRTGGMLSYSGLNGNRTPPVSSNLIGFTDEHEVVFVGEDAETALKLITDHVAKLRAQPQPEKLEGWQRMVISKIKRGLVRVKQVADPAGTNGATIPMLRLWASDWNDWLHAIHAENHGFDALPLDY